jgi:hypothetical protein
MHLAIDFDGTLRHYKGSTPDPENMEPPLDGAVEWVRALVDMGHTYTVFTSAIERKGHIWKWLQKYGFPIPDGITNIKQNDFDAMLDDKAIRFDHKFFVNNPCPVITRLYGEPWWKWRKEYSCPTSTKTQDPI